MKKSFSLFYTFLFCLNIFLSVSAQTTGNFNDTISFMGQNRTLSCHVPNTYDSNAKYKVMIGLHGLGDNSVNYRNFLVNNSAWPSIFDSTIFIFPDGGSDQNKDFYAPLGDEAIIAECIQYAKQNYSIDSTEIILQGFSLGGRSALKYGLENTSTFKGLLLNTPALQGLLDVENDSNTSLIYPYLNSSQIPIYVTIGSADDLYVSIVDKLINTLKKSNAKLEFVNVNGLGHTIPGSSFINPAVPFFEDPSKSDFDLEIFEIEMEERSCDPNFNAGVYVRNLGNQNINTLEINYQYGGSSQTHTWNGSMDLYEHTFISLPINNAAGGSQNLDASIGNINGTQTDPNTTNDQLNRNFEVVSTGINLPLNEGFEANEAGWIWDETGSLFEWTKDNSVSRNGQNSIFTFNTILIFNTLGEVENFSSPVMDLSSVNKPYLAFDLAYNYHQYTPPYFTDTVNFADTLEIQISTDCGASFQTIYRKGGADLATAPNPIVNPLTVLSCFFTPADSSDWRRVRIDLSAYSASTEAVVKFNYISALGGSINIDNIDFDDASVISIPEINSLIQFEMYPNPASSHIEVYYDYNEVDELEIYNLSGNMVYTQHLGKTDREAIDVNTLPNGFYIVRLSGQKGEQIKKLSIRR